MTTNVAQRERSLRHEVQELRIEIDATKGRQQVEEIEAKNSFRDRQAKAQVQRARRGGEADEAHGPPPTERS